ncbi:MAG: DUF3489 domain-containing protein [Hyphomicrobiaceae bacterium]
MRQTGRCGTRPQPARRVIYPCARKPRRSLGGGSPDHEETRRRRGQAERPPRAKAPTPRKESKQAQFIEAMRTPKGIGITEAAERFGWQKHTVRGAIAGAVKKKLGLKVDAEQDDKRGTVYRIRK